MPICYKAAAIGQSLVDGQEVHKVKAPKPGKHDLKNCFHDKDNTDSYSDTETETTLDNDIWQKKNPDWYPDKVKENRSNGLFLLLTT